MIAPSTAVFNPPLIRHGPCRPCRFIDTYHAIVSRDQRRSALCRGRDIHQRGRIIRAIALQPRRRRDHCLQFILRAPLEWE